MDNTTISKAIEKTDNFKLGPISTTYSSIHSCPDSCALKHGGCYGRSGFVGLQWSYINHLKATPYEIAIAEAKAIDGLTGNRNLRIHTVGDAKTDEAAAILSGAAERHMKKAGKKAFTYTHAWKDVKRRSWGKVSVLASCETPTEVRKARKKGYATALVVSKFQDTKAYEVNGLKVLPCPEMTGKVKSCAQCRLCMDDKRLKAACLTIAFQAHGASQAKTLEVLIEKNA